MREYEQLTQHRQASVNTTVFLGLNRGIVTADGQMNAMLNLTSDYYPQLSPCHPRVETGWNYHGAYHGSIAKGASIYSAVGDKLYKDGTAVDGIVLSNVWLQRKKMVSMGAYICIWPDKVWLNTATMEHGSMEASWSGNLRFSPCTLGGTIMSGSGYVVSATAPSNPNNGQYWCDTSGSTNRLMVWSSAKKTWSEVTSTYIRIENTASTLGANIKENDAVRITLPDSADESLKKQMTDALVVYARGESYIVVTGIVSNALTVNGCTIKRSTPDFDYVVESNNRLWGCRYGEVNGKHINELHACKLGDFNNWDVYEQISTDSYAVSLGSDGGFTGAMSLNGTPVFFKEGCMHRVSGNTPSQFTMTTTDCRGVDRGDALSLQRLDQYIVYKCRDDVLIYTGTFSSIGKPLGQSTLAKDTVCSCSYGMKYYLCLEDGLYVYDLERRMWHMEDSTGLQDIVGTDERLYYVMKTDDGVKILRNSTEAEHADGSVEWEAVFGAYGYDTKTHKYLSRFDLRLQMEKGSEIGVWMQYDHDGHWRPMGLIRGKTVKSFMLPVIPRRCDHCQLKLTGTGRAKLMGIARIVEQGSDS